MLVTILFWAFAAVLVASALGVIVARNPVHSALLLVLAFFTSAAIWLLIQAEFLAIVLVLVRYVVPPIAGDAEVFEIPIGMIAVLGGMLCAVLIVVCDLVLVPLQSKTRQVVLFDEARNAVDQRISGLCGRVP